MICNLTVMTQIEPTTFKNLRDFILINIRIGKGLALYPKNIFFGKIFKE